MYNSKFYYPQNSRARYLGIVYINLQFQDLSNLCVCKSQFYFEVFPPFFWWVNWFTETSIFGKYENFRDLLDFGFSKQIIMTPYIFFQLNLKHSTKIGPTQWFGQLLLGAICAFWIHREKSWRSFHSDNDYNITTLLKGTLTINVTTSIFFLTR